MGHVILNRNFLKFALSVGGILGAIWFFSGCAGWDDIFGSSDASDNRGCQQEATVSGDVAEGPITITQDCGETSTNQDGPLECFSLSCTQVPCETCIFQGGSRECQTVRCKSGTEASLWLVDAFTP